jgi:hypothetical protein
MGRNPARFAFPNRPPGVLDRTSRLNPGLARVSISDPGDCGRACPASLALGAARPTRSLREMPSSQSDRRLLAPEIRESSPKLQMWKTCQAFRARYGSFVSHSTPLPSLYPQSYLADFRARLGILIIGGKKGNSPDRQPQQGRLPSGLFHFRREDQCNVSAPPSYRTGRQKAQVKWLIFINLPQSKMALLESLSGQTLAGVPWGGGRGWVGKQKC